ncbi:hypothetical protein [Leucobacter luti]|uniref:hypothetical protein n=1 Tax=Leucobacter luti TaxID=340320 RepID=UPI00102B7351|nr:hypothetical protein [Leucobacter luti]
MRILGVIVLLGLILIAFLVAFALPGLRAEPTDVPVALVAPDAVAAQLEAAAEDAAPGAIAWTSAEDLSEALRMIREREVVGALAVGADGLTALAPSAAGPTIAALVTETSQRIGDAAGLPVTVTDPLPFTEDDPRGIGLSAGALPIALGGWIAAVGIIATVRGSSRRVIAALGFAVLGGAAMVAVLRFWLGTFDAHYPALAAAGMLGIAATSLLVLGLQRLLKGLGITIAALILILLGNPLSGLTTPRELLPVPWGDIGQFLPPGATGALLRNVGFFDAATAWGPALVLAGWALIGVCAYALGGVRERRAAAALTGAFGEMPAKAG